MGEATSTIAADAASTHATSAITTRPCIKPRERHREEHAQDAALGSESEDQPDGEDQQRATEYRNTSPARAPGTGAGCHIGSERKRSYRPF